jgi:hypothetical protein
LVAGAATATIVAPDTLVPVGVVGHGGVVAPIRAPVGVARTTAAGAADSGAGTNRPVPSATRVR